jgi:cytochrome c
MDKAHIGKFRLALLSALCLAGTAACSKPAEDSKDSNPGASVEATSSTPVAGSSDYATLAADAGQVEAGKKLFSNCAVCHSVPYSQALKNAGGSWTPEKLDVFLKDPMAAYPGTSMAFGGLAKEADRKAIIAYLASIQPK